MLSPERTQRASRPNQQASAEDLCRIFHQDMHVLYWLALTLTSDEQKAEQCFVAGLDECIEGNSVFKEWARSWSRRVVIKNAIRLVAPRPGMANSRPGAKVAETLDSPGQIVLAALTHLKPFDRFIFVMSVLEGYADRDCAALLGCSSADVPEARIRTLRRVNQHIELCSASGDEPGNEPRALCDADVA